MDIQAERRYKEMLSEDSRQFMPLFDDSFPFLYRYVARRVVDERLREQIVRIVYFDAVGQMTSSNCEINFTTWLYGIARLRVHEYMKGDVSAVNGGIGIESPVFSGASIVDGVYDDEMKLKIQAESFFSRLNFEEREILKLKFFEELTDGEMIHVLGGERSGGFSAKESEASRIGVRIFQVLKRAYEILFGKVEDGSVYFGELYSFLARLKDIEKIPVPEALHLKLRVEIESKVLKMYSDKFRHGDSHEGSVSAGMVDVESVFSTGSKDPAKIFAKAARGMSKQEVEQITKEYVEERELKNNQKISPDPFEPVATSIPVQYVEEKVDDFQKREKVDLFLDFWEKWKYVLSLIPSGFFVLGIFAVIRVVFFARTEDDGVLGLTVPVDYGIGFEKNIEENIEETPDYSVKIVLESEIISEIVKGKDVDYVKVWMDEGSVSMSFSLADRTKLEYLFGRSKNGSYKVKSVKKL